MIHDPASIRSPSWQPILTSSEKTQLLSNTLENTTLDKSVGNSLLGPIKTVSKILDDGNLNNDDAACDKLDEFIANVESKRDSGKLNPIIAQFFIDSAESAQDDIPC